MHFPQVHIKNCKHSKTATITKTDDPEKFLHLPQSSSGKIPLEFSDRDHDPQKSIGSLLVRHRTLQKIS